MTPRLPEVSAGSSAMSTTGRSLTALPQGLLGAASTAQGPPGAKPALGRQQAPSHVAMAASAMTCAMARPEACATSSLLRLLSCPEFTTPGPSPQPRVVPLCLPFLSRIGITHV